MDHTLDPLDILNEVSTYYGKTLHSVCDLQTNACAVRSSKRMFDIHQDALKLVQKDILARYYGCGHVIPEAIEGQSVLDLGCGTGTDCFVLSKLVGENGKVVGVDMAEEQLAMARDYTKYHTDLFGYKEANVTFRQGLIEQLIDADVKSDQFHIIVSNCVVNLTPDKAAVLREAYRVLKFGGEFYLSDINTDREQSEELRKNKVLWCEGLSGALMWKEFYRIAKEIGFAQPRIVSSGELSVADQFKEILGEANFTSTTYRMFKLPAQGITGGPQAVIYRGGILGHEHVFTLDIENAFKKNEERIVTGETGGILSISRFAKYFTFRQITPDEQESCCFPAKVMYPLDVARLGGSSL